MKRIVKDRILVASDLHIPYHDSTAVKELFDSVKTEKPEHIVLLGDVLDNFKLSSHDKSPLEGVAFDLEIKEVKKFLITLRRLAPHSKIYYVKGNHEDRLERYINKQAKELAGWEQLEMDVLLGFDSLGIEYYEEDDNLIINDILFKHGHEVQGFSTIPANNARKRINYYGMSICMGHGHRANIMRLTLLNRELIGIENPCLCNLKPKYVKGFAQWQQGFTIIDGIDKKMIRQVMTK